MGDLATLAYRLQYCKQSYGLRNPPHYIGQYIPYSRRNPIIPTGSQEYEIPNPKSRDWKKNSSGLQSRIMYKSYLYVTIN